MNTRSDIQGQEVFYLPILDKVLEVQAHWEDGYLTGLDLKMRGDKRLNGLETGKPSFSGLREGLMAILDGADPRGRIAAMARGTLFQTRVWAALMGVPYGTVITYSGLAQRLDCGSSRAVGQALKANPLPLIIPCHRVVGKDGGLGGYSCGLDVKRLLLMNERGDEL
jgi:methylated-DNA-[protein]-cysteine S-methyltransferase